jgi:amino-acid N-acetyltransferase
MTTTRRGVATIRRSTREDLPAIERLLIESGLPTTGVAEMLAADSASFVVAEANGDASHFAGVAGLEVCRDNALLRSVAVRPEWRSHGLGSDLVTRIVSDAESRGIHALYLLTLTAEQYFPRFGFERVERNDVPGEVAETVEFKSACPSTAAAMRKVL